MPSSRIPRLKFHVKDACRAPLARRNRLPKKRCRNVGNAPTRRFSEMKRRDFLKVSAAGAAAATVASPAIAHSCPEIKWRLTSSFPKSLDPDYGGAESFAKQVAEMTD